MSINGKAPVLATPGLGQEVPLAAPLETDCKPHVYDLCYVIVSTLDMRRTDSFPKVRKVE